MKTDPITRRFKIIFAIIICVNITLWFYARPLQVQWPNVPPAPSQLGAQAMGLGDTGFAYRLIGVFLQNLGNVDGRNVYLGNYKYEPLKEWFFRAYELDAKSSYIPFLAGYYYGAVREPESLRHVLDFLKVVGQSPNDEKWRWLTHGVFIARHRLEDLDLAMNFALLLKDHENLDVPLWARHIDALVLNAKGEKEDAYEIMKALLATSAEDMHPSETLYILDNICDSILSEEEAALDPLCNGR
jgi:tetratricopeptide (TPR) repeat protein